MKNNKVYSVWVGAVEVNDYYLTKKEAQEVADHWKRKGYGKEVQIEKVLGFEGSGIYDSESGVLLEKTDICPDDLQAGEIWEGSEADYNETFKQGE